jgi:transcription initiation factor TFIIF subunit alpha
MRFNATLNVDFTQWKNVKMERENNMKEFKGFDEDMPKFGAGSEFNRDLREEARRKKFGIIARKYKPEAQPWILKSGGKAGKKFRGVREGGVGENASFYVFTHAPDGAIEAYPLNEWYNFQPIQRYKALTAEEAEHEFGRRKKVLNYFSLMLRKRLKGDDVDSVETAAADDDEGKSKKAGGKGKELKISEMDDWMDSSDASSEDSDEEKKEKADDSDAEKEKKSKQKKKLVLEKKKKRDVDDEAFEDSDDGDEEGRELDYISDSSESESDSENKGNKELKSVAEESALRKLLTDNEEDSEDEEKKEEKEEEKKEEEKTNKKDKEKDEKNSKDKKKKKTKTKNKEEKKESSSDSSSDSSDSNSNGTAMSKKKKKDLASASNSRSASPSVSNAASESNSNKRKAPQHSMIPLDLGSENSNSPSSTPAKKSKMDTPSLPPTFSSGSSKE